MVTTDTPTHTNCIKSIVYFWGAGDKTSVAKLSGVCPLWRIPTWGVTSQCKDKLACCWLPKQETSVSHQSTIRCITSIFGWHQSTHICSRHYAVWGSPCPCEWWFDPRGQSCFDSTSIDFKQDGSWYFSRFPTYMCLWFVFSYHRDKHLLGVPVKHGRKVYRDHIRNLYAGGKRRLTCIKIKGKSGKFTFRVSVIVMVGTITPRHPSSSSSLREAHEWMAQA